MLIPLPPLFRLTTTIRSHGWHDLPPFQTSENAGGLGLAFHVSGGPVISAEIGQRNSRLVVGLRSNRPLSAAARRESRAVIRSILRLDEDFSDFYRCARQMGGRRWIASAGAGRLLRAPTVFEDLIKLICTTNCTWGLTSLMVKNLVRTFGEAGPGGAVAFPTPGALAETSERVLRTTIKAGYRSPYILELARRISSGALDVEAWRSSELPTEALYRDILTIRGVGPYAAENLLRLLGRYEFLGLDSWVRAQFGRLYHGGRRVGDRTIERRYRHLGRWRGLFFWLDMTRHWHDDKFPRRGTHA